MNNKNYLYLSLFSQQNFPECSEALKANPSFKGECLTDVEPTIEELNEFYSNFNKNLEHETVLVANMPPCPPGYLLNKSGKCKKVLKRK